MPKNEKHGRSANALCSAPIYVSQNYLTGAATINHLMRRTSLSKDDHVLEIGPGKGHITRALLRRCGRVTAVELDADLCRTLRDRFAGENNLRLIHADFLKFKLPKTGCYKVFSNIPFNHTTEILRRLTECRNPPEEIWLVAEKGAAKRFMGLPRENLRSLLLKPYFDMDIAYYFRRGDFHPEPGVDTVLLHLKKKAKPDIPEPQLAGYRRFVEAGLRVGYKRLMTPKQISSALRSGGFSSDFTPAHLLYVQWLCLFRRSI
jgi:23S rRNA (adenine-N6)-dimethyltransferase